MMPVTLEGLIVLIVAAGICGAVGKALTGGAQGGFIVSVTLGVIGSLLVPWVAQKSHLSEPVGLYVSGHLFPIGWSIIGAALFVALLRLAIRIGPVFPAPEPVSAT